MTSRIDIKVINNLVHGRWRDRPIPVQLQGDPAMSVMSLPDEVELLAKPEPGKVEKSITATQPGWVYFQATSWSARIHQDFPGNLEPGHSVWVIGRKGNTLLVLPGDAVARR
jgi:hypothetical protein